MVKLGIIGTGGMAHAQADMFRKVKGCRLDAACDVDPTRVAAFATRYGIARTFTSTAELLRGGGIDAVSVVTPDAMHAPVTLEALRHGVHVLCEKPLALNVAEARKMTSAARRKGVVNMVNFSYRRSGALEKAAQWIRSGKLGEVLHFEASYLQSWLNSKAWGDWRTNPAWLWRLSTEHGSKGVLGDVGVHIIDMATYAAGEIANVECRLKTFDALKGRKINGYRLDANDSVIIQCELKNGALGTIHATRWAAGHVNSLRLRVYCERGGLEVDLDRGYEILRHCTGPAIDKATWLEMACKPAPNVVERFVRSVRTGKNDQPDFARGAAVQRVLDACFESDAGRCRVSL